MCHTSLYFFSPPVHEPLLEELLDEPELPDLLPEELELEELDELLELEVAMRPLLEEWII